MEKNIKKVGILLIEIVFLFIRDFVTCEFKI